MIALVLENEHAKLLQVCLRTQRRSLLPPSIKFTDQQSAGESSGATGAEICIIEVERQRSISDGPNMLLSYVLATLKNTLIVVSLSHIVF